MENKKRELDSRDTLIDQVRRGKILPDEAEAEAARQGFGPLAAKPDPVEFDPAKMPWWSLPMALAWIAWRSTQSVREHCAEYRQKRLLWVPGSWNIPSDSETEFERIDGYELKSLRQSTAVRLSFVEAYLRSAKTLPATTKMTVSEAEKELFAALAAGRIVAIAKDAAGRVVDIPQREWPYLQLLEEQERDVLKHDALDREAAFSEIKLQRDDLQAVWEEYLVEPYMIEPMMRDGTTGYVPLCCVVHWIMTEAGTKVRHLEDRQAWTTSVAKLIQPISTGEIEIIGRPRSGGPPAKIEGHVFAGILVAEPLHVSFEMLTGDVPWVGCTPYVDDKRWGDDFNDHLYLGKTGPASWTHLQVKKSDVLREIRVEDWQDAPTAPEVRKRKVGRKPQYDWDDAELFVCRELDSRGDFDDADQVENWSCQADLERSVADYFSNRMNGRAPAISSIREKIGPMVDAWRAKQRVAGNSR
jgi:hypothetical protein